MKKAMMIFEVKDGETVFMSRDGDKFVLKVFAALAIKKEATAKPDVIIKPTKKPEVVHLDDDSDEDTVVEIVKKENKKPEANKKVKKNVVKKPPAVTRQTRFKRTVKVQKFEDVEKDPIFSQQVDIDCDLYFLNH